MKPFECQHCQYKTSQKSILETHIKSVHEKIKSFQCQYCEHKTAYKSALNIHIKAIQERVTG